MLSTVVNNAPGLQRASFRDRDKDIWNPVIGEVLVCEREEENNHDHFAIACKRDGTIVGHLPRSESRTYFYFLAHDGVITATVTGARRYCHEVGGMEVPCELTLTGKRKHIEKLKNIVKRI